jgi:hypothetical protein
VLDRPSTFAINAWITPHWKQFPRPCIGPFGERTQYGLNLWIETPPRGALPSAGRVRKRISVRKRCGELRSLDTNLLQRRDPNCHALGYEALENGLVCRCAKVKLMSQ